MWQWWAKKAQHWEYSGHTKMLCFEGQGVQGGENANGHRMVPSDEMSAKAKLQKCNCQWTRPEDRKRRRINKNKPKLHGMAWHGEQKELFRKSPGALEIRSTDPIWQHCLWAHNLCCNFSLILSWIIYFSKSRIRNNNKSSNMYPQGWRRLQTFIDIFVWSIFNSYHTIHAPFR